MSPKDPKERERARRTAPAAALLTIAAVTAPEFEASKGVPPAAEPSDVSVEAQHSGAPQKQGRAPYYTTPQLRYPRPPCWSAQVWSVKSAQGVTVLPPDITNARVRNTLLDLHLNL